MIIEYAGPAFAAADRILDAVGECIPFHGITAVRAAKMRTKIAEEVSRMMHRAAEDERPSFMTDEEEP